MKREEEWLTRLLRILSDNLSPRFAGLGLVVYRPPMLLPVTPLIPAGREPASESTDVVESAEFLRKLANSPDNLHDGFHLVDAERLVISHTCQYVAPPIPPTLPKDALLHPVGARHMTALLTSLLPSVVITATLSKREGVTAFVNGAVRPLDTDAF